ncbi:MAG: Glyceraldehyde-3-phosphate dehydrogenase 1 [Alphaproteobacteria bacterium MarineAlpha6_Bin2]|nr:MAG: Glyceraldehyde-3-phosphate dehydrogenase 1 [Alphaproteobacteria bacterium MarineAlpha6_Bin2]
MVNLAINGFGRIGRLFLRALIESKYSNNLKVKIINDLADLESNVHLFKYDSIHGTFNKKIKKSKNSFDIGQGPIKIISENNPSKLPWNKNNIDIVIECTGILTAKKESLKHIEAGAKRVIISAPSDDPDKTVVYGVNHKEIKDNDKIISNASCTTNCLAPIANILNKGLGINEGHMTTIHSFTGDQSIVDTFHKSDLRRARSASLSLIPTNTGAAKAIGLVIPSLEGKLDGTAIRVPTANVSLIDFVFNSKIDTSEKEINRICIDAANRELKDILSITNEPLVSVDFNHSSFSSNFDTTQTKVINKKLCRVLSWYDNEWGFASRLVDLAKYIA